MKNLKKKTVDMWQVSGKRNIFSIAIANLQNYFFTFSW